MTEFLKNNPIALRHCLLYEFLQARYIEKAFSDFCDIIGNDFIKREEFQKWFDRFKQGIFDDIIEPIADMRDILRNDEHAHRTCILYESLKNKRIEKNIEKGFEHSKNDRWDYILYCYFFWQNEPVSSRSYSAYKNFCKVIGDDVMKYREFDFRFYRFLNGDYDLDFEMDKDKKIYELSDMPLDIMKSIVYNLDVFDRMSLAGTSRSLKTFVEGQKAFHSELILHVDDAETIIIYGMEYPTKTYENDYTLSERMPYWKKASQKVKAVLNYPNLHVINLKMKLHAESRTLVAEMIDELLPTRQLHLQNLYISTYSTDPLLKILPSFTPGYLTKINVDVLKMDDTVMNKVTELEQWKQATSVSVNRYFTNVW
ncbi:unnamed protein product [Caenorhabditis brenneri]